VIVNIEDMRPQTEDQHSSARPVRYALEMNQGWFKRNAVRPGAQLDLKAVAAALKARGLKPEAAGLRQP